MSLHRNCGVSAECPDSVLCPNEEKWGVVARRDGTRTMQDE
jgi:hypothetical protein